MSRRAARFTEADVNRAGSTWYEDELRRHREQQRELAEAQAHERSAQLAPMLQFARKSGSGFDLHIKENGSVTMHPNTLGVLRAFKDGVAVPVPTHGRVYFVGFSHYVKIGYTGGRTVKARVAGLQTACPEKLTVYYEMNGGPDVEASLHREFAADRLEGEWFRYSDAIRAWIEAKRG